MRLVLIRHGQSGNNVIWEQTGSSVGRHPDTPLTDRGHDQARRLAAAIADGALPWRIDAIYTSLMTRAVQTAAPIANALDLPPTPEPRAANSSRCPSACSWLTMSTSRGGGAVK